MKNTRSPSLPLLSSRTKYTVVQFMLASGEDIIGLSDPKLVSKKPDVYPLAYAARVHTVLDITDGSVSFRIVKLFSTSDLVVEIKRSSMATADVVTPSRELMEEYTRFVQSEQRSRMLKNFDAAVEYAVKSNQQEPWYHAHASQYVH